MWSVQDSTGKQSPELVFPIAACKAIKSSYVDTATNNGLNIQKLKENWSAMSTIDSAKCDTTSYGVFDGSSGNLISSSVTDLYNAYFKEEDCSQPSNSDIRPYMSATSYMTCPNVKFTPKCDPPEKTYYAMCKNPGWGYMKNYDTNDGKWEYDMSTCVGESFSGDYEENKDKIVACGEGACCVYASQSQDDSSVNCASCTEAASQYSRDWSGVTNTTTSDASNANNDPTPYITYTGGENERTITLPYCNLSTGGSTVSSTQGVAISLSDAVSNENVGLFGDPVECLSGGLFDGKCNGITGSNGLLCGAGHTLPQYNACLLGFSSYNSSSSNPASNCPTQFTLQNLNLDCKRTLNSDNDLCVPYFNWGDNECSYDKSDNKIYNDESVPQLTKLEIPEGAWVIAHDPNFGGGTTQYYNTGKNLCDINNFSSKSTIYSVGCGRDEDGELIAKYNAYTASSNESWSESSSDAENITGSLVDEDNRTCTFNFKRNGAYTWAFQHGFMPGYYNSTCVTNKENKCGVNPY